MHFTNLNIPKFCCHILQENRKLLNSKSIKNKNNYSWYEPNKLTIAYFKNYLNTLKPHNKTNYQLHISCLERINLNEIQIEVMNKMLNIDKFIISLEQGMGKTRTIIAEILHLSQYYNYQNFIILLPATYIPIWHEEINKINQLTDNKLPRIQLISLEKYRLKKMVDLIDTCFQYDDHYKQHITKLQNTYLCIDESIVIKNANSKNYESCKSLLNFLETIKIISPKFYYRVRMTTGSIQSENIKDWNYICKFFFNLRDNAIDINFILSGFLGLHKDDSKFKYEINKLQKLNKNVAIRKRVLNTKLQVHKITKTINFWSEHPFIQIHNYYHYLRTELKRQTYNIHQILDKHELQEEKEEDVVLLNLRNAVIKNRICSLVKDINYHFDTDLTNKVTKNQAWAYMEAKKNYLWNLKECAEALMPFKTFNYFYQLDSGILTSKFIIDTLAQYCIFYTVYNTTQEQKVKCLIDAIQEGHKILQHYTEDNDIPKDTTNDLQGIIKQLMQQVTTNKNNNQNTDKQNFLYEEKQESNTIDKAQTITISTNKLTPIERIVEAFASRGNIALCIDKAIAIYQQETHVIQQLLLHNNYVSLFQVFYSLYKNKINISCDEILTAVRNAIHDTQEQTLTLISQYYRAMYIDNTAEKITNTLLESYQSSISYGIIYHYTRIHAIVEDIISEYKQGHNVLIFFEFKTHIKLLLQHIKHNKQISDINVQEFDSNNTGEDRINIIQQFNQRKINVLLTTYSLTARGFNFNNTITTIFFMPTPKYELYNQAKYRNNRFDTQLRHIYHINYEYDKNTINNKLYMQYRIKEIKKNIIENAVTISPSISMNIFKTFKHSQKPNFEYLYNTFSSNIRTNELSKQEFIDYIEKMYNNLIKCNHSVKKTNTINKKDGKLSSKQ